MSFVENEKVLLVGGIPRPIGGVTQHVWRLSLLLGGTQCTVCDVHPRPEKYAIEGKLNIAPFNNWLRLPWLVGQLCRSRAAVSHLHFSTCSTVGLIGPFLTLDRRDRFRMLTLHHGNQQGVYAELGSLMRGAVKRSLRQFDRIVCLSEAQHEFYHNVVGIPENKLFSGSSYVPLHPSKFRAMCKDFAAEEHDGVMSSAIPPKRSGTIRLVASGYPSRICNHHHAIKFVDSLRRDRESELYLCLYGLVKDQEYHAELLAMVADRPYVHLLWETSFPKFATLLKGADLYLRPTTVDSYGIAVADSILLGTPALVSDVCVRHPNAVLFPTNDFEAFEAIGRRILRDPKADPVSIGISDSIESEILTSLKMYTDVITLPRTRAAPSILPNGRKAV